MKTTDGLIIRCPECGAFNVMLNDSMDEGLLSCMSCEGSINPHTHIVYKHYNGLIP